MSRIFFDLRVESTPLPDYQGHEFDRDEDVLRYAEELALKLRDSDVFSLAGAAVEVRSHDGKKLYAIPVQESPSWPAPGSEDTELGVLMEPEVDHGATEVYTRVQA